MPPVLVEVRADEFAKNLDALRAPSKRSYKDVRRPYRGIEIKDRDGTFAIMKVLRADGTEISLVDAGGSVKPATNTAVPLPGQANLNVESGMARTYNYSNFIIQTIQEVRQEKAQILETFGESYVFFFGERPRMLQVTGLLMNTLDFNWRSEFWYNYENYLRGTKLVEQNARIHLYWDDILVEGYMMQAAAQDNSELPYHIPFSFQLLVTNHTYLANIGDDDYPVSSSVYLEPLQNMASTRNAQEKVYKREGTKYDSRVEATRKALQNSASAREAAVRDQLAPLSQGISASKNLVANALTLGLTWPSNGRTFLSLAAHFLRRRRVLVPRGLAGSEAYVGVPEKANTLTYQGTGPQRKLPLRSKIRHNYEEYVQGGFDGVFDDAHVAKTEALRKLQTPAALEAKALASMAMNGVLPVQHLGPFFPSNVGIRALSGSLNPANSGFTS